MPPLTLTSRCLTDADAQIHKTRRCLSNARYIIPRPIGDRFVRRVNLETDLAMVGLLRDLLPYVARILGIPLLSAQ